MDVPAERRAGKRRRGVRILKLELKRLLKARRNWALFAFALVCSVLLAYLPTTFCYSSRTDAEGNEIVLTGLESIAYEKQRQAGAAGTASPERIREAVETYQACLKRYGVTESYDLPEGVYEQEILPLSPLLHGVKEAFADPKTGMAPSLSEVDPERLDDWEAVCEARIEALMKLEQPDNLAAQRRAAEMYRRVEKPFSVYPGMSSAVLDYQNLLELLVLLLCTVIAAPAFSAERQPGADDILRGTLHGGARMGAARAAAVLLVSAGLFAVCAVVQIVTVNALFGWECGKTSVQMLYSIVSLTGMDVRGLQWFFAGAGLLAVLASVSCTLFVSARCKSAVSALAAGLLLCVAPTAVFLALPGEISAWLCALLPAGGVGIQTSILYAATGFRFLNVFGLPVWTPYAILAACLIELPLFFWLTVRSRRWDAV